jgi:hypothetical protein
MRRFSRLTRVRHPVPDVAAPAAKVFRVGADSGASIDRDQDESQVELQHSAWAPVSAPGSALGLLLSRALSSAQAVLQFEAVAPFLPTSCSATSHYPTVSRVRQQAIALGHDPRTTPGECGRQRELSQHATLPAKGIHAVPFPLFSIGGTGTLRSSDQSRRCQPTAVRLSWPARSKDSSTSPRRSFLTARQSRSFARVSTMPPAK